MYWLYFFSLCGVAVVVLYLLWYYPNPQTTLLVRFIVGLAWFASLSVLVLVPADVSRTLNPTTSSDSVYGVSRGAIGIVWAATYWTTIVFVIFVLPFLQKYSDSGGFLIRDRCEYAIRKSAQLMVIAITVVLTGFLILLVMHRKVTPAEFLGWIVAFLNAYGLIGAICLMGYGLVDIPRKLWQRANHRERQNFLFQTAGMQLEKAAAAHLELSREIHSVHRFDGQFGQADPMRPYMDVIVEMLNRVPDFDPQDTEENDSDVQIDTTTRQGLGILRQRLRKAIEGYYRERQRYLSLVQEYLDLHETIQNENRPGMPFLYLDGRKRTAVVLYWVWWWRCRVRPLFQRLLAILTGVLSLLIVLSEATIPDYIPNLSAFAQVLQAVKSDEVGLILVTFFSLFYPMTCMYYTLIRLGQFSFYRLVPKHTAPFSLASNALLLCRFVCPLCFNFYTAVALPIKDDEDLSVEQSEFWDYIGERISDMPVLGKYFTTYIPIMILPYVLLIAFNGVNRVMSILDPKLKFSFKDDWVLDMDSNYASNGRRVMNLEVEYFQKGWDHGMTLTEGLRISGVASVGPISARGSADRGARVGGPSPWNAESVTRVVPRGTPGGMASASHPSPFDLPIGALRRAASLETGSASMKSPLIPHAPPPRRSAQDLPIRRESDEMAPPSLAERLAKMFRTREGK